MTTQAPAVIVAAARTAIGTSRKGSLAAVGATQLAEPVITAAIERSDRGRTVSMTFSSPRCIGEVAIWPATPRSTSASPPSRDGGESAVRFQPDRSSAGLRPITAVMSRAVLAGGVESCSTAPVVRKRKPYRSGTNPDDWIDPWFSY
ncbi:hypothetical protein LAUMK13_05565 [Mycobacterium innocens]|uniref:Uncharacterized protein n=1 Tax=Mycobacterium innocens TaxID=2341083 RepID=A0A498QL45_9MYCO|nr:hypothetical protein LAUMK13_05565 [Mycobacterium innocens]